MKPLAFLAVPVVAVVATLIAAVPAWAHTEISPSSVPPGKPVFFTLSAANEKSADLTRITLTAPEGLELGHATRAPAGWTVTGTARAVTWTGGAVAHDRFDSWGFEIEGADQPGTQSYRVTLGYADGSSEEVEVPVTVTAGDSGAAPAGQSAVTTATTAAAAVGGDALAAPESESGEGRANVALAISVVALIAAVAAAVVAARRSTPGAPAAPAASASSPAQDW